ncbi:type VI secretion protein ImpG [Burkholderia stagnalis]|uniref:Type VI secretion system baseplate subunit TssF n=1 Tax=Burkholderia stagnalis TaxID=1503054 RepID=A0A6L3N4D0_9BURK|nr:type VI secretion system baseplate subunit TssF [Burkholderia stagnalis]KAB0640294.1 type VI secretion system baseplate subunit TssF [Burkholderia stagnalis]KVO39293.1 type VI secretion protein ImpG [Burkholderia stagnalis]KVO74537.1 type VI secretion protein ImpG [Burkholderia stagnalis]KVW57480.1 type VI secretion protein ImpG [Burkholderia stagnalis]KVW71270.1 type VI secretion protein ImpG [Burkholderia stagnalis]
MSDATKDNEILRYYEAEMRYLRDAGKEFAHAFPDRARMLNIDRIGDRDPHVERLFEGFAFLMGRLRHKLDDELPELTEGLVSMLWPHYLRMIPSLSILELSPANGALQKHETLAAGLEVMSDPIPVETPSSAGGDGVRCVYRTTQEVDLYPLRLSEANAYTRDDGRSVLRFRFETQPQVQRAQLTVPRLRLFLNADRPVALALYAALVNEPAAIHIRVPGYPADRPGASQPMHGLRIEPAGFAAGERLWPKADNAFGGYQLLLEYFTFPEKFMFVDLLGLDMQAIPQDAPYFDVEVVPSRPYPDDMRFSAENVRLFCTPIINLFPMEADPIVATQFETEYRVHAIEQQGDHVDVYSVDTVQGFEAGSGRRFEYAPFASFRHRGGMLRHEMPERYFHSRMRRGPSGRFDTWVVLGGHAWEQQATLPKETLSLSVTGTNGMLPRKALREASMTRMRSGFTNVGSVRNLTAPTLPVYPPTGDRFQWRVLSHLSPNYLSLLNPEILRGSLALYDWTDGELNKRRIEAIIDVKHRLLQKLVKGGLQRGVEIEVTLDSSPFAGEGDIELFGGMLNRFLGLYATLNLFTKLVIVTQPTGRRITWPDTKGDGAPF